MFSIYKICRLCCFSALEYPQRRHFCFTRQCGDTIQVRWKKFMGILFRILPTEFYQNVLIWKLPSAITVQTAVKFARSMEVSATTINSYGVTTIFVTWSGHLFVSASECPLLVRMCSFFLFHCLTYFALASSVWINVWKQARSTSSLTLCAE